MWNGTSWSALGNGIGGAVHALTVYNNNLYAGGYFTTAGVSASNNIAKWNGTSWDSLGAGTNGTNDGIYALTVYNGNLYASGSFDTIGGNTANSIAEWNGTSWSALGSGINGFVDALTVYNSNLYAGGAFTTAGGNLANNIAEWNDGTGIDQINGNTDNVFLYPNPLTSSSILQFNTQLKNAEVVIYNMLGKEMMRKKMDGDRMEIERGSLESGVYFVRVSSEDRQWVEKMVVE